VCCVTEWGSHSVIDFDLLQTFMFPRVTRVHPPRLSQWVASMVAMSDQDFIDLFAAQGVTPTVAVLIAESLLILTSLYIVLHSSFQPIVLGEYCCTNGPTGNSSNLY
jgi:hypothetical protein